MIVSLEDFQLEHVRLLKGWLQEPHVQPWYPHPLDDIEFASSPPEGAGHWLIVGEREPIGYIRWRHVDRATLDELGLHEVPANSVDIDILLGDTRFLGKGYGPQALNFAALEFLSDPTVAQLGLTTSIHNTRAHQGFSKAGFVITRQYRPPGLELCHLMIRDLARERAKAVNADTGAQGTEG